jgi:hypothetical protein
VPHLNSVVPDVDWDLDLDSEPDLAQLVRRARR